MSSATPRKRSAPIEPPTLSHSASIELRERVDAMDRIDEASIHGGHPPSFAESQFLTIVRRQRIREENSLKVPYHKLSKVRSRDDPPPSSDDVEALHAWGFAGWGKMSYLELPTDHLDEKESARQAERVKEGHGVLGAWLGTGVAGVAVAGSPFYAFPAVVAAASVFSPISLLIATLLLSFWRPIMCELASALPQSGANYIYLLNSSTKNIALVGCCITLLDDVATAVVSAATAAAYLGDSVSIPVDHVWLTVILIVAVGVLGLLGVREGAGVTSGILAFHLICMASLIVAGAVHWGRSGNALLASNWHAGQPASTGSIAKAVYNGVCVAFLGVTGYETTPDYISSLRPNTYPSILRNLQIIAIVLNAPLMLLTFANLPAALIAGNGTVLSSLAQVSAGSWLRILLTIDAVLILCAGVLTGIISAAALVARLTDDRILPAIFRARLPVTHAPYISLVLFVTGSLVVWAASGADTAVVSGMFALVFLIVMTFFPIVSLFFAASRPYLQRTPRTPLLLSLFTLALGFALIVGNIILTPITIAFFVGFAGVLYLGLLAMSHRSWLMHLAWWLSQRAAWSSKFGPALVKGLEYLRGGPVVLFIKRDEIHRLFQMLLYCRDNEETACVKLVHFYRDVDDIPSELEANFKILDEAFPQITVDLIFVQGDFSAGMATAAAEKLGVPISMCFVGCPRDAGLLGDLAVRIIGT